MAEESKRKREAIQDGEMQIPQLDAQKLQSLPPEQQDLYLFTFSDNLGRHVDDLDHEGAAAQQGPLKKEILKVITLVSPAPTRVIRNIVGRALAGLFRKGDRKLLFESINELLGIINGSKGEKDLKAKHAAVHCLGTVFEDAGDSAISLSALACSSLIKSLKAAQNHVGFRAAIYKTLGQVVKGVKGSLDETVARDVWKQARNSALGDKALLVQTNACCCLEQLLRATEFFDNSNDYEKLKSVLLKTLDSPSLTVRHAVARCLSATLVKAFTAEATNVAALPDVRRSAKTKKKQAVIAEEDGEIARPATPSLEKPATTLNFTFPDLLRQLSMPYCRQTTTNRTRAGLATCYVKLFKELGQGIVEANYGQIANHFFNEILSSSTIVWHRYRLLLARKHVRLILEGKVARQLLGETGELHAARYLIDLIKEYPQATKEHIEPGKQVLIGALSALSSLIEILGSATSLIAEACRESLFQVLQHPSYTVQVYTSHCFKAFVAECPSHLLPSITICMNSVDRELGQLTSGRRSPRRCTGYANGLAAILSTASLHPLYSSVDITSRVFAQATNLLKWSSASDLRVSITQIQVAWTIIGGLMSVGPNFVKMHLSQLLLLWKNALPKALATENGSRTLLEISFVTHVRECALGALLAFTKYNNKLLTTDVSKKLAGMLKNTASFLQQLPSRKTTEDVSQRLQPSLQLQDLEIMVRRRVMQCYAGLIRIAVPGSAEAILDSSLLPFAMTSFADPEKYAEASMSTSIANSAGTFDSIWEVGDNNGFGITSLVRGLGYVDGLDRIRKHHWSSQSSEEAEIDNSVCLRGSLVVTFTADNLCSIFLQSVARRNMTRLIST